MFCTSKERETCDVEKRGCEGCFYMNEEETGIKVSIPIITNKELEDISKNYDNYIDDIVKAVVHEKDMVILQTIIKEQKSRIEKLQQELQNEKEKNKKLEEENKYLQDYLDGMEGALKEQIKEQSREIAELQEQLQES